MLALSFPRYGHAAVALGAVVPLLVAMAGWRGRPGVHPGQTFRRGAALGATAGVVHYLGTIYWTGAVVQTFGGLPAWSRCWCALALALYMAAYTALASGLIAAAIRRLGARGLLLAPPLWVAAEFARGYVLGGFPWIPLGSAVVTLVPVAQLASVVGVYGLSCVLVAQGALVARALTGAPATGSRSAVRPRCCCWSYRDGAPHAWPTAASCVRGRRSRSGSCRPTSRSRTNGIGACVGEIGRRYDVLTRRAAAAGARAVLWPESATPYFFNEDPVQSEAIRELVRQTGVPLLFGTDEIERGRPDRYYNSAFMLDPPARSPRCTRKIQLVPFGEFVPLRQLLFFVEPLVEAVSDFSPGAQVTMLPMGEHMASTAICYEVVYPHLIRRAVLEGAELLTTITNDAWYGTSSAPYQHFELASMRAIEQGRYLARAANTGISGIVDPYGRAVVKTPVFEEAVVTGEVRFLQSRTVYATIGDLVAQASLLVALLTIGWLAAVRRARSGPRQGA